MPKGHANPEDLKVSKSKVGKTWRKKEVVAVIKEKTVLISSYGLPTSIREDSKEGGLVLCKIPLDF